MNPTNRRENNPSNLEDVDCIERHKNVSESRLEEQLFKLILFSAGF